MADLSVMGFLNEETQQETEYNLKDAQARSDISTINSKIPSNASSSNKLATISDVSAAYKPKGNATLATLPSLTVEHLNWVYNMTEDFVTTSDFAEGAGKSVKAGNEVGIIDVSETSTPSYKYTVLGGFIDTSSLQPKTLDTPVEVGGVNRTTVEAALGALANDKEDTIFAASPLVKEYDEVMRQEVLRLNQDDTPTDNSNNPVKSSGIKSALSATVDLMKDTTGWIGGNLFNKDATPNNIQGAVQAIPTATGVNVKSTASGPWAIARYWKKVKSNTTHMITTNVTVASGESTIYIHGSTLDNPTSNTDFTESLLDERNTGAVENTFSTGSCKWIQVGLFATRNTEGSLTGDVTYSDLMILTEEQYKLNPSYRPYHGSVEEVKADKSSVISALDDTVGWVGKSIVPNNLKSRSSGGVTVTVNADKSVTLDTGGEAIPNAVGLTLNNWFTGLFKEGVRYKVSDVNGSTKCYTYLGRKKGTSGTPVYNIDTTGAIAGRDYFTYNSNEYDYYLFSIYVLAGTILDNVTLYPMVSEADVYELDPSYRPYHESVEEMLSTKEIILTANSNYGEFLTDNDKYCYKWGKMVKVDLDFKVTTQVPAYTDFISGLPKVQGNTTNGIAFGANNAIFRLYVSTSGGDVKLFNHSQPMAVGTYHVSLIYMSQD